MRLRKNEIKNEIKEEIIKFLETNKNELTTLQNLWDTAKAVLRGKFTRIQAHLKKVQTFQIDKLTLHLQEPEEQEQKKPRVSRRKEITKIRAELNDIETTNTTIQRINKSRSWFFEKTDKINEQTHQDKKREDPKKQNQK